MSRNAGARRPARWSIGAVSLAALCASAGCSAILGVEDAILISAQSGGSAGAAQGGTAGSGASSGAAGKGTAGSEVGGAGGTSGASGQAGMGGTTGGTAGKSGAGAGGAAGGAGGGAGTGGAGGSSGVATLGTSCTTPGALACAGNKQKIQLICGPMNKWDVFAQCMSGFLCDSRPGVDVGTCAPIIPQCVGKNPGDLVCDGKALHQCGPDLVSSTTTLCKSAAHCSMGACLECVDEFACVGAQLQECVGNKLANKTVCTSAALCNPTIGACTSAVCNPGQKTCNGDNLVKCNATQTAFEPDAACAPGLCDGVNKQCDVCSTSKCTSGKRFTCSADGQSLTENPCPVGAPVCTGLGQCVECAGATDCPQDKVCAADNTCKPKNVTGVVLDQQPSFDLSLTVNGAPFVVAGNGAFVLDAPLTMGAAYTVVVAPPTPAAAAMGAPTCTPRNGTGSGTFNGTPISLTIGCAVAKKSVVQAAGMTTMSPTYVDIDSLSPITFTTDTAGPVLVTLSVPSTALAGMAGGNYGETFHRLLMDGVEVEESVNQTAYWGSPTPTFVGGLVNVSPGPHTLSAQWRRGTGGLGAPTAIQNGEIHLAMMHLPTLTGYKSLVGEKTSITGNINTANVAEVAIGTAPISITDGDPVLFFARATTKPVSGNPNGGALSISSAGPNWTTRVASSFFWHEGTRKTDTLLALLLTPSSGSYALGWAGETSVGTMPTTFQAVRFKPGTLMGATKMGNVGNVLLEIAGTDFPLGSGFSLNFPQPRRVVVGLQVRQAYGTGSGPGAVVSSKMDGAVVGSMTVLTQNSDIASPAAMLHVMDVPAGDHMFTATFRTTTPGTPARAEGPANLFVIGVE